MTISTISMMNSDGQDHPVMTSTPHTSSGAIARPALSPAAALPPPASAHAGGQVHAGSVRPRRFPYPYKAMLAICSDLDETPDARVYEQSMRFLNTTRDTIMGEGVGLEVGNTIYFDMPSDQFAYHTTDDRGREMIRALIRSGHIDCLHSFGDFATTRDHAARAIDELARHDCRLQVWIDHAVAPSNLGADIMCGLGDVPGSPVYHADLLSDYGIGYVWRGRVTSVIGQDVPRSLGRLFTLRHPIASARTLAKEAVKGVLGRRDPDGSSKYAMHGPNALTRIITLRDGRPMTEFIRFNPHYRGVDRADTARGIAEVLTDDMLDCLVDRGGIGILYTHLGKVVRPEEPFEEATRRAFRRLAEYERSGRILVTTTRRLLGYRQAREYAVVQVAQGVDGTRIRVRRPADRPGVCLTPEDLDGLTFYVDHPERVLFDLDGRGDVRPVCNPPDETGLSSVSVPWRRLEYPCT